MGDMPRPRSPNKYRRWNFSLPAELHDRLNATASRLRQEGKDVSAAEIVRQGLERHLDYLDQRSSPARIPQRFATRR